MGDGSEAQTQRRWAPTAPSVAPERGHAAHHDEVAQPVITEMARRGTQLRGLLCCGLAMTSKGIRVVGIQRAFRRSGDPRQSSSASATPLAPILYAAATAPWRRSRPRVESGRCRHIRRAATRAPRIPDKITGIETDRARRRPRHPRRHVEKSETTTDVAAGCCGFEPTYVVNSGQPSHDVSPAAATLDGPCPGLPGVDLIHFDREHHRSDTLRRGCRPGRRPRLRTPQGAS